VEHYGTETITISNAHQALPWKAQFVISVPESVAQLTMTLEMEGANAKQQLEMAEFQQALSVCTHLSFIRCDDGTTFVRGPIPSGLTTSPHDDLLLLLRKLTLIQQRTGVILSLPREINDDDFERILTLAQIVETGEYRIVGGGVITIPATRQLAENLVKLEPDPNLHMYLRGVDDQRWEILGESIPVGKVVVRWFGGEVVPQDAERVRQELADEEHGETFQMNYDVPEENDIRFTYEKFLPEDERKRLEIYE
jgi:hypothetical protein